MSDETSRAHRKPWRDIRAEIEARQEGERWAAECLREIARKLDRNPWTSAKVRYR